jgi:hypothetical protein
MPRPRKSLDQLANARAENVRIDVKELVRGRQQQRAKVALRKRNGRECLIVCLLGYVSYLNVSLHTSTP